MEGGPSRRWLADLAALHAALAATPTLHRLCSESFEAARDRADLGDAVEEELIRRICDPQVWEVLAAEVLASQVALADLRPVVGLRVAEVPGTRKSADAWLHWVHEDGETSTPVNIKVEDAVKSSGRSNRACALGPLLSYLTDPAGNIDRVTKGIRPDEIIAEMLAGKRKLVPGRDYQLLVIRFNNDGLVDIDMRSLIARHNVDGTGLALSRHLNRDVAVYEGLVGDVIGPDCDIVRELATALLPRSGSSRLRAEIVALAAPSRRRAVAQRLANLSDAEILARITSD